MSDPVTLIKTPMRLDYRVTAGSNRARFLRGLMERKILGQRCVGCRKVYVPPRGCCPTCGTTDSETVELGDHGTVTTFSLINIPFENQAFQLPYGAAAILLDGSDLPLLHLLNNIPVDEIRMGWRVKAVWSDEPRPTLETINWFEASGEPDADYDSYKEHL